MIGFAEREPVKQKWVKSKAKCPKCKSDTLKLNELWKDHCITWEQENGEFDRQDGYLEPGDAYKVFGECRKCGHIWTIRGALQIDDVTI